MLAWIDTEFNDYKGALISLALVTAEGREFYVNLGCNDPSEWVAQHVMPILDAPVVTREVAQAMLQQFMARYHKLHIIADWPDDLKHLNDLFITGPGTSIDTPHITMEIDRGLNATSLIPHNALADARAIKCNWIDIYGPPRSEDLKW